MYTQKQIKPILYIVFLSCFCLIHNSYAQNKGLNFQGVARSTSNLIIASKQIKIKLSIIHSTVNGNVDYSEIKTTTTNEQGLFAVVIGDGSASSSVGNFNSIDWSIQPKYLKIEIDPTGENNFVDFGSSQIQYTAYAHFANGVAAENIEGLVPVARGGTGTSSLTQLKKSLSLDSVNNTIDLNKPISTATQTALDLKLNKLDNAVSATKLATSKNINGVAFDGTSDITISTTTDAGNLTGTTLNSNVIRSNLTSVGTITVGVWSTTAIALTNGGTGATNIIDARANLGLGTAATNNTNDFAIIGTSNNFQADIQAKTYILTNASATVASSTNTVTIDLSSGNVQELILQSNTSLAFSNPRIGTYIIQIKQDAAGGRSLNFPNTIMWSDSIIPIITSTANKIDIVTIIYTGSKYFGSILQNF